MLDDNKLTLDSYVEDAYLRYAIAVVKGRALAEIEDGLKPVQRRILFAMMQLGLQPTAKAVKSARVVGDVLGKYHPHGDQSVYDAMVRMAQPFTLRYPLIEGQGNFGSLDGDSAAAMRYTEARLSPVAELLLAELRQGTVDYAPNYDGQLQEPVLTPSRLPLLLLNGTMGIAVGMAAEVPPHNLREVTQACIGVVEDPGCTLDDVLQHIKGPDFPGGGQLVSSQAELRAAYGAGRGGMRCRAKWVKEDQARGQWQIVVTELPYQVSTKKILEQIEVLTNPQPPSGKKTISQQQANLKQVSLDFLEKVVDESDKDNSVRLVIVPRNSKVDPESLMAFLLANTSLEDSVSLNLTVIGLDGRPGTKTLLDVLQEWATFRVSTVRRRTQWELAGTQKRLHILEGRMAVFLNLDKVIKVIRDAEEPKPELIDKFSLSDVQAEDILEMRLRQLNRLEGIKLERDVADLRKEETRLLNILSTETEIRKVIVSELKADGAKFGDDRRTLVKPEVKAQSVAAVRSVLEEDVTVVVSKNLWVKAYKGKGLLEETFVFKQGDAFGYKVETSTVRPVIVLGTKGRSYSFAASGVPSGRGEGAPLSTFIEVQAGAKPFAIIAGAADDKFLFAGANGYGFIAPLKNLEARNKAGKAFLTLDEDELALQPQLICDPSSVYLVCASSSGKVLVFAGAEVKLLPNGGKGVMLMGLGDSETMPRVWLAPGEGFSLDATLKGKTTPVVLKGETWLRHLSKRGRKGAVLPKKEMPIF